jgi:hypothetical protein
MQLPLFPVPTPVASAHYYLDHFRLALEWLRTHYDDVLSTPEQTFIEQFIAVPRLSQALLVRLAMRKGPFFRASRIQYTEIGDLPAALAPLVERQWVDQRPRLSIGNIVGLLRRSELKTVFPEAQAARSKAAALELLRSRYTERRCFRDWGGCGDEVYELVVAPLCTQLRLLFFGNFRHDWSEFVLADLGIVQYETVCLSRLSRPFASREDVESFFALYECQRALDEQAPLASIQARLPRKRLRREWLESRRSRMLFQIARRHEAAGAQASALKLYRQSHHPEARLCAVRVLESQRRLAAAHAVARTALHDPRTEVEAQRLARRMRRLERRMGLPAPAAQPAVSPSHLELVLPPLKSGERVERVAGAHFERPLAPVFYVENSLINSLFGLLCWDAVFAPVRGAFFHPFQAAPLDLFTAQFVRRRRALFDRCLGWLEPGAYRTVIRENFASKYGLQSPFVSWVAIPEELLELALDCIPAPHLRRFFERLLEDLGDHRSGLPDLIQFRTDEQRYQMIEVKAPGDRVQDNQRRWIDYCLQQDLPVAICQVRWAR